MEGSATWQLPSPCLVGRNRTCQLRGVGNKASGEHALLRWRDGCWVLQDLDSRNGTFVDGRRLPPGRRVALEPGACIGFARPEDYVLFDAGPPQPHAIATTPPHTTAEAHEGRLVLPRLEQPELVVFQRDQQWWLERDGQVQPTDDEDIVSTASGSWRLQLPEVLPSTLDAPDSPTLASLGLRILVTETGEPIEIVVHRGDRSISLMPRAHHRPLLALARLRLEAHAHSDEERGWIKQSELIRRLEYTPLQLHVEVHRIRRQLAALGVIDAPAVIEEPPHSGKIRLGITSLEVAATS